MTHLWEVDHPYYCEEGNHFKNGQHYRFASWGAFTASQLFAGDRDLNLLFRWDWKKPGYHEWEGNECLELFFVLQRKPLNCSCRIEVTETDEPRVRRFLEECARTMAAIWFPILGG